LSMFVLNNSVLSVDNNITFPCKEDKATSEDDLSALQGLRRMGLRTHFASFVRLSQKIYDHSLENKCDKLRGMGQSPILNPSFAFIRVFIFTEN
jgi:hypothetical protein